MSKKRRYGGKSGEERAAERRLRLLSAALDLLAGQGADKVTVTGVCNAAQLSERYFYESFSDRSTLLDAVFDEISRKGAQAVIDATALAQDDPRSRATAFITALADMTAEDERLSMMATNSRTDEAVMRGRAATAHHIAEVIDQHADRFWDVDGASPVRVKARAVAAVSGVAELMVAWRIGSLDITREALVEEATDFFLAAGANMREPMRAS